MVLRAIRIETSIKIGEIKHQWPARIDIIYLVMYGIPQINKSKKGAFREAEKTFLCVHKQIITGSGQNCAGTESMTVDHSNSGGRYAGAELDISLYIHASWNVWKLTTASSRK